jgi:hypothetical protein
MFQSGVSIHEGLLILSTAYLDGSVSCTFSFCIVLYCRKARGGTVFVLASSVELSRLVAHTRDPSSLYWLCFALCLVVWNSLVGSYLEACEEGCEGAPG